MLSLSDEAKRLTSTFLAYRNDVDIYTEDEDKDREFYKSLFRRLLKSEIKVNDVTPLGSKSNVLARCQNEPKNGRKKLFIVDGDVTIINGYGIPAMENLFVLDAYCIENFLFDEQALLRFIYLNCATKSIETITAEVDFEKWLSGYSEALIDLFIHFALCNLFGLNFTLFNANKYHIKDQGEYKFSTDLVLSDIQTIRNSILQEVGIENYEMKYTELKDKWSNCLHNFFTIVSGKDYLIPILLVKTKQFKKSNALPTIEETKVSLLQFSNLNGLKRLKDTIEAL